jgi:hypothetical protein
MDRALAGAHATNELDLVRGDHLSARQIFLSRAKSAGDDSNRTTGRGHNAMTERRIKDELGLVPGERGVLSQPGREQSLTRSVGIQFLPQTVYRLSFDYGLRNVAKVGDVN